MIRPSLVELLIGLLIFTPAAAGVGWGVVRAAGGDAGLAALLMGLLPPLAVLLHLAAALRAAARRRRALVAFAEMAGPIRAALSPGLLWAPEGRLEIRPDWDPSAHDRIRLATDAAAQAPPMPPGWPLAARALYGARARNALPGLWMDREERLHLAHMRIAGAPFLPERLPSTKDAP
jgi:hypothetical protein